MRLFLGSQRATRTVINTKAYHYDLVELFNRCSKSISLHLEKKGEVEIMSPGAGGGWKRFSQGVNSLSQPTKSAFTAAVSSKFIVTILPHGAKHLKAASAVKLGAVETKEAAYATVETFLHVCEGFPLQSLDNDGDSSLLKCPAFKPRWNYGRPIIT